MKVVYLQQLAVTCTAFALLLTDPVRGQSTCATEGTRSQQCGAKGSRRPSHCCDPLAECRRRRCYSPLTSDPSPAPTPTPPTPQITSTPTYSDISEGGPYTCPPPGSPRRTVNVSQSSTVELTIMTTTDVLCTLVQISPDGSFVKPVGRSYNSFKWEPYSGPFNSIQYSCSSTTCTVNLPPLEQGFSYALTTYATRPSSSSSKDDAARFLEQTTFGATWSEIQNFSDGDHGAWIANQMSLPISSHRHFLRERTNANFEASNYQSLVTTPCQEGTRYRKYAFTSKDVNREVVITTSRRDDIKYRTILVDGQARTVVKGNIRNASNSYILRNGTYLICKAPEQQVGGMLRLDGPGINCQDVSFDGVIGNPEVNFYSEATEITNEMVILDRKVVPVDAQFFDGVQELFVDSPLTDDACRQSIPSVAASAPERVVVGKTTSSDGVPSGYWLHMSMWNTLDNTVEQPLADGGGSVYELTSGLGGQQNRYETRCSNAPRTFLNEDHCIISTQPSACTEKELPDVRISLISTTFSKVYDLSEQSVFVYAITGLRQELRFNDPPCKAGARSRWIPSDTCEPDLNANVVDQSTQTIFADLLKASTDTNPYLRDVIFPDRGASCVAEDQEKFDFKTTIAVDGKCWKNVHPDHLQVRDFTSWVQAHPGNRRRDDYFPIRDIALDSSKSFFLPYPSWHEMDRWMNNFGNIPNVGRYGDGIRYKDLPVGLQRQEIAEFYGEAETSTADEMVLVCGSPYEVGNDLRSYGNQGRGGFDIATRFERTTSGVDLERQRVTVWMQLALNSKDQLRQRVAWALSQILVVSPSSIVDGERQTEGFLNYYDIFVRNAFGNYRDILKEVSYSPMMGEMLSYLRSQSTAYIWKTQKRWEFADENYAREIMQLFSMGLYTLNPDGTQVVEFGESVSAYSNDDITEYARVWTGFGRRASRGNIEDITTFERDNMIDPMAIDIDWRDHFPKLGVQNQYIGDGWPLCSDLAPGHFLRKGAIYRLLGSSPSPQFHKDSSAWVGGSPVRFELPLSSRLRRKLCNNQDPCDYQIKVELDSDITCSGLECSLDTLRVFAVGDVYYEYIRPACVNLAFYENAKMVKLRSNENGFMCADPTTETASIACCSTGTDQSTRKEIFSGERASYATASDRCKLEGYTLCEYPQINDCALSELGGCDDDVHFWTSQECGFKVKVNRDGSVAMVHDPSDSRVGPSRVDDAVKDDSKTFFRVEWLSSVFALLQPSNYENECKKIGCAVSADGFCTCDVVPSSSAAFSTAPTREQVLNELHYGAVPVPTSTITVVNEGVKLHSVAGIGYTQDSIFEVVDDNGILQWRKNLKSTVKLGTSGPIFRNPVHFIALSNPEPRDAQHETEAAIDHYFYHPNTAPFIAVRLAQRFGISNPSPRYVEVISKAFRSGRFSIKEDGVLLKYGNKEYGDLAATVAAILLDREARTAVLDADPMHGSLQEPFLKFVRLLRSLEFSADSDYPLVEIIDDLQELIGQEAFKTPSVFSFFKPEYQPPGVVAKAGQVSPEAQVLSGPKVVNIMNSMLSFVKYGINSCYEGAFRGRGGACRVGSHETSYGYGAYAPPSSSTAAEVVDELATLLTSGRLSQENRAIMKEAYAATMEEKGDPNLAYINVQQLIATTAEFHTTGTVTKSGTPRPEPNPVVVSREPYKAVIFLMLEGGYDSFNMLVPERCSGTNAKGASVREQYDDERGNLAFSTAERSLVIDIDAANPSQPNQPCEKFAIHDELPLLKELYDSKDLLFFANAGVINESGMDKSNWADLTVSQLFAHNSMQEETKKVDPFNQDAGTGVLGRASDVLAGEGFNVNLLSIDNPAITVDGTPGISDPPLIVSRYGATEFNRIPNAESYFDTTGYVKQLHGQTTVESSIFGEIWSDQLVSGIRQVESLATDLNAASLSSEWEASSFETKEEEMLWRRFSTIAKLIQTHDRRGTDHDFFYTNYEGWDHHREMKKNIRPKFKTLNYALKLLVNELKAQGVWDSTTIVVASDFARTITPNNSKGSDHGWGGNYFMMGGSVAGGRILGQYPDDLTTDGPLNIGRGRMLPTLSWDAIWSGVLEWADVPKSQVDRCLPNNAINGPFFDAEDLFN